MKVDGRPTRSIWLAADGWTVEVIDQRRLPHRFEVLPLTTVAEAAEAIRNMTVRGAPLIGVTAAFGMALGLRADAGDAALEAHGRMLAATRPTAVNLRWAVDDMLQRLRPLASGERAAAAYARAGAIADEDVAINEAIGRHALPLIEAVWQRQGRTVNVLTHCNAGWLATVDWGTALSGIFLAHERGLPLHVWVDETRPRNQGASLTAWELAAAGVPHTVIVDNAGGHLMQHGRVDLCFVGTDRVSANGDVANKIGTYLKALAAHDNKVPFYVCLPSPTIDWTLSDGFRIPIEERAGDEVSHIAGLADDGTVQRVRLTPAASAVANPAFDVTPARLVTGLVTERGVAAASREGLSALFPEHSRAA